MQDERGEKIVGFGGIRLSGFAEVSHLKERERGKDGAGGRRFSEKAAR